MYVFSLTIQLFSDNHCSLGVVVDNSSLSQSLTNISGGSQFLTQSSSLSQYSAVDKFMDKAIVLPLNQLLALSEVYCVVNFFDLPTLTFINYIIHSYLLTFYH
jgi:hypothetical protein